MEPVEETVLERLRRMYAQNGFLALIRPDLRAAADGEAEVALRIDERLVNRRGHAHGGIVAALADTSMSQAVRTRLDPGDAIVTAQMNVHFLQPGEGELVGHGWVTHIGRSLAHAESRIVDDRGRLVAHATGVFRVFRGGGEKSA